MATTTSSTTVPTKTTGRGYLWLGLAVGILAPFLYVAQLAAKRLTAPWYVPILGTVALCLVLLAVIRVRTVGRKIAFLLLGVLATGEWFFLLYASKVPAYAGPVAVGQPFPAFATTFADGPPFTQADLLGERNTVMVFFRGRW